MADTILDVRNLQVQFQTDEQTVQAVDGLSLNVQRGQTLGIVGESGSGKSVTALSVMQLVPSPPGKILNGDIVFGGGTPQETAPVNLLQLSNKDMQSYRGSRIAMIFQEPMSSLNPVYTCGFQIVEALQLHQNISKAEARRRAVALLQEVKLIPSDVELHQQVVAGEGQTAKSPGQTLSEANIQTQMNARKRSFLDRYPHELSGGQLQRVMIAMAISCNPDILIADEPTTALDVTVQATILNLLRELRDRRGMSIIFVTHDLGIIAEIADTVAVMYKGKVVETATVQRIFEQPQHPYTKALLACRPQPDKRLRYLPTVSDFPVDSDATAKSPNGQPDTDATIPHHGEEVTEAEMQQRLAALEAQTPLVTVDQLQVFFPVRGVFGQPARYVTAVNGVSFQIYPGETLGLVGESGCGKTTLGRALVRLIQPTGGTIRFDGQDITGLSGKPLRQLRQHLQIIFQDPFSSLDPRMSIGAAIWEPIQIAAAMDKRRVTRKALRDRAAELLTEVGLNPNDMGRYPHAFSGGQRQRICIARALALNPKFVICDESVSALDVSVQAQVLNLLKALQGKHHLTYLFISHDLSVVKFMSDRIMVMNRGKIEEIGPADEVYRKPKTDYTRKLIESIPVGLPSKISISDRALEE